MADFITQMLEFYIVEVVGPPLLVIAGIVILCQAIRYHDTHRKPKKRSDITKQK